MIRAIPRIASDNVYCTLLAHSAVHGAMAGYTGFIGGPVNGRHAAGNRKTEQGGDKDSVINQSAKLLGSKISAEAKQRKNQRPN